MTHDRSGVQTPPIELGNGHRLLLTTHECRGSGEPQPLSRYGYIDEHLTPVGEHCEGIVQTCRGCDTGTTWEVLSEEPLTLSPSLLCTRCGDHGFVREGKWVPA